MKKWREVTYPSFLDFVGISFLRYSVKDYRYKYY